MRRVPAGVLGVAALLAIGAATRFPYPAAPPDHGVLRLSWRTRGERVEECRRLTPAEIAQLPIHMRREEVCEGRVLPYLLVVEMDGRLLLRERVLPAGARHDRPLYVFHEIPIPTGEHRLAVRFVREDTRRERGGGSGRGRDDDHSERRSATPSYLELETGFRARPGEVTLVTYDADQRELVARSPGVIAP